MAQSEAVTQLAADEAASGLESLDRLLGAINPLDGADLNGAVGEVVGGADP